MNCNSFFSFHMSVSLCLWGISHYAYKFYSKAFFVLDCCFYYLGVLHIIAVSLSESLPSDSQLGLIL